MKRYPKLKYPDHKKSNGLFASGEIFVQEKLDGANVRFTREAHLDEQYHTEDRDIAFGSRNVVYKNQKDERKSFAHAIRYIRETVPEEAIESIEDTIGGEVTIFGEAMHPHTLEYNFDNIPSVVGFDIWDHSRNKFVNPKDAEYFIEEVLGIEYSPILDVIDATEWDEYSVTVPESAYGDVKAEGLVLKNPATNVWSKIVRQDFKEKNSKTFGKSKKQQSSGAEKLSYQYITNARIRKSVHKLIDEGEYNSLEMKMMEQLPEVVIRDMAQEEAGNVFMKESWEIDTAEFRSITSSRCARLLRKMINEKHFE